MQRFLLTSDKAANLNIREGKDSINISTLKLFCKSNVAVSLALGQWSHSGAVSSRRSFIRPGGTQSLASS